METNDKYISIPPYLSTSWRNVRSLHMRDVFLVVTLVDGSTVEIPNLKPTTIEKLFMCHANFLHYHGNRPGVEAARGKEFLIGARPEGTEQVALPPFRLNLGGLESFGAALHHNPSQANMPDLPTEMLQKIAAVARIVSPEDAATIPKAEPHCNCMHCQISRAIHVGLTGEQPVTAPISQEEEMVTAEDLTFKEWDIVKADDNLYVVANPLNPGEEYKVHLGKPVGCTCGHSNCEHIIAVLKS